MDSGGRPLPEAGRKSWRGLTVGMPTAGVFPVTRDARPCASLVSIGIDGAIRGLVPRFAGPVLASGPSFGSQ